MIGGGIQQAAVLKGGVGVRSIEQGAAEGPAGKRRRERGEQQQRMMHHARSRSTRGTPKRARGAYRIWVVSLLSARPRPRPWRVRLWHSSESRAAVSAGMAIPWNPIPSDRRARPTTRPGPRRPHRRLRKTTTDDAPPHHLSLLTRYRGASGDTHSASAAAAAPPTRPPCRRRSGAGSGRRPRRCVPPVLSIRVIRPSPCSSPSSLPPSPILTNAGPAHPHRLHRHLHGAKHGALRLQERPGPSVCVALRACMDFVLGGVGDGCDHPLAPRCRCPQRLLRALPTIPTLTARSPPLQLPHMDNNNNRSSCRRR